MHRHEKRGETLKNIVTNLITIRRGMAHVVLCILQRSSPPDRQCGIAIDRCMPLELVTHAHNPWSTGNWCL